MKRFLAGALAGLFLVFGLAGCQRTNLAPRVETATFHHLKSGQDVFEDQSGFWWWYVLAGNGSNYWQRGEEPPYGAMDGNVERQGMVTLDGTGTPEGAPPAVPVAPAEGGGDTQSSTGPTSDTAAAPADAPAAAPSSPSSDAGGGGGGD